MSGALLSITLIAVIWLSIWSVKDRSRPSKTWWPFDMREYDEPANEKGPTARDVLVQPSRANPTSKPWHRSGS